MLRIALQIDKINNTIRNNIGMNHHRLREEKDLSSVLEY